MGFLVNNPQRLMLLMLLQLLVAVVVVNTTNNGCVEEERLALLEFKRGLILDPYDDYMDSWKNSSSQEDCCSWKGITCDTTFNDDSSSSSSRGGGHVIWLDLYPDIPMSGKISPSLLALKHLEHLSLKFSHFIPIPPFFGSFSNLMSLYLSGFGGPIPPELGKLYKLEVLSIYEEKKPTSEALLYVDNLEWMSNLSSLNTLEFDYVDLGRFSNWTLSFSRLTALRVLGLLHCNIPTSFHSLNALNHLESLDLLVDGGGIPIPPLIGSLQNLTDLSLYGFEGPIPPQLGMLPNLQSLSIYSDDSKGYPVYVENSQWISTFQNLTELTLGGFEGPIPPQLGMLPNLQELRIYSDDSKGYPVYVENSQWISNLSSLHTLDLGNVDLGRVLDWELSLSRIPSLQWYGLRSCNITFRDDINHGFPSLTFLWFQGTKLGRSIPSWIFSLNNLTDLALIDCSLETVISEHHFANLTSLQNLYLSNNPLFDIQITPNWVPPFSLTELDLSSCRVGPAFPSWIRTQENLTNLYLSSTSLVDFIPTWIWDFSTFLFHLDLSQNKLYGGIPHNMLLPLGEGVVDLSSNNLSGQLPSNIGPNLVKMNLSYNSFSGSLSRLLCHKVQTTYAMEILDLENNLLSGNMSDCWDGWRNLVYLSFSNNNLTGSFSESFANLPELQYLHLRNNRLSGNTPLAVHNWRKLVTLDLSNNKLEGSIFFGELSNLRILTLDSNKFSGIISQGVCSLTSLQILNLSSNNLFGPIPTCFQNFKEMVREQKTGQISTSYNNNTAEIGDNMPLSLKGRVDEYGEILGWVTLIDLSNNHLSGEIPKELMDLKGLHYLNIFKNQLTGKIPMAISNMSALEYLDLSRNKLSGEIPSTISQLTLLSHLNVSHNKLTGRIPSGPQLDTSSSSSFIGNTLCGKPLPETCGISNASNPKHVEDSKEEDDSRIAFYVSFPLGFGAGASTIFITLLFRHSWRIVFFRYADTMLNLNSW